MIIGEKGKLFLYDSLKIHFFLNQKGEISGGVNSFSVVAERLFSTRKCISLYNNGDYKEKLDISSVQAIGRAHTKKYPKKRSFTANKSRS